MSFWYRQLFDITSGMNTTIRIPPAARIQTCPPGSWPWQSESNRQREELGPRALHNAAPAAAQPRPAAARILEALAEMKALLAHNVEPIHFQARRLPKHRIESGADLD